MTSVVLTATRRVALLATVSILCAMLVLSNAQDEGPVSREYLTLDWTEGRAYYSRSKLLP